jgi:hypothetical protein
MWDIGRQSQLHLGGRGIPPRSIKQEFGDNWSNEESQAQRILMALKRHKGEGPDNKEMTIEEITKRQ